MKKILVTLLGVATLSISAMAQEKREKKDGDRQMHQKGMKHRDGMMAKELNLTEEQKKQAKTTQAEFRQKMQELNKNENITVKEMREKREALKQEQQSKMQSILTTEQKAKMEQLKTDRMAKGKEMQAKNFEKMRSELNLTDAQVSQLKSQREAMHAKAKAIKENQSLSKEQKKEQMKPLKAEAKTQRSSILNADQMKKMEELKAKRGHKGHKAQKGMKQNRQAKAQNI